MILVLNAGSSTLKYHLYDESTATSASSEIDRAAATSVAAGSIESIGELNSPAKDHSAALEIALEDLQRRVALDLTQLRGVGHRIVHGGIQFGAAQQVTQTNYHSVRERLETTVSLAPLHNPPAIRCLEAMVAMIPDIPQTLVFDTGFFHDLPEVAQRYALPTYCYEQLAIRRYGAHGTSHRYVSEQANAYLSAHGHPGNRLITLHLGNGASMAAVRHGKAIDTTMGLTPLEGLVMGTRCGDIDPAIVLHLQRHSNLNTQQVDHLLNRESGLKGICGDNDMRIIERRQASGDATAALAFNLFCTRIRKYIGAYLAELGGLDALVFTAGIGEHSWAVRAAVCDPLAHLGIAIDAEANMRHERDISAFQAKTRILVIPTLEDRAILQFVLAALGS